MEAWEAVSWQHVEARTRGQAKEISDPIFDLVVADVDVLWD